jgi:hypothetical protein
MTRVVHFRVSYTPFGAAEPIVSLKSQLSSSRWRELEDDLDEQRQFCSHIRLRLLSEFHIDVGDMLSFSSLKLERLGSYSSPSHTEMG